MQPLPPSPDSPWAYRPPHSLSPSPPTPTPPPPPRRFVTPNSPPFRTRSPPPSRRARFFTAASLRRRLFHDDDELPVIIATPLTTIIPAEALSAPAPGTSVEEAGPSTRPITLPPNARPLSSLADECEQMVRSFISFSERLREEIALRRREQPLPPFETAFEAPLLRTTTAAFSNAFFSLHGPPSPPPLGSRRSTDAQLHETEDDEVTEATDFLGHYSVGSNTYESPGLSGYEADDEGSAASFSSDDGLYVYGETEDEAEDEEEEDEDDEENLEFEEETLGSTSDLSTDDGSSSGGQSFIFRRRIFDPGIGH